MTEKQHKSVRTFDLHEGGLTEIDIAGQNLDEVSRQLPDGVYTTLRTFGGRRFLCLDAHFERLEKSAAALGQPVVVDRGRLRCALAQVLQRCIWPETRVRIIVPLGDRQPAHVYLCVEPFAGLDPRLYETGVQVMTMPMARAIPRAKSTAFIQPSRTIKAGLPADIFEVLMVTEDGQILEGFTSNFFAVIEGCLVTAAEQVLEGITRSIVLQLAAECLPIVLRAPRLAEVERMKEAFITSSSRGVLPVVKVDQRVIGPGRPGPWTRELRRRYDAYVDQVAEEPCGSAKGN